MLALRSEDRWNAHVPGDLGAATPKAMTERREAAYPWLNDDLLDKRYQRSYLQFDEEIVGVKCPAVPIITTVDIIY